VARGARLRPLSTPPTEDDNVDAVKSYVTVGLSVLAGVALLEAALIPGLLIGGAAVLAPKYLPGYLPSLRRRVQSVLDTTFGGQAEASPRHGELPAAARGPADPRIRQAIVKTITFRIVVTTLDFSSNYVVIGELTTAAGLSAFALVVGPIFYLAHETAWNYFGPLEDSTFRVPAFRQLRSDENATSADQGGFTISRALAKTITFRTIATVMDFTATFVVVGDLVTAAGLSAFGFVVGPFVYLGHEMVWDRYRSPREGRPDAPTPPLLPAST
jgi:uncharacterized membrane protein